MAIFIPNTLCDEKFRFLAVYGPSAPKPRTYIKTMLNKEAKAFEEDKRRGYVDADARFPYDARKAKLEEQVKQPEVLDSLEFFDFAESSFDVLPGWENKAVYCYDSELETCLSAGRGYGILTGHGDLVVVEIHHDAKAIVDKLPKTWTIDRLTPKGEPLKQLFYKAHSMDHHPCLTRKRPLSKDEVEQQAKLVLQEGTMILAKMSLKPYVSIHGLGSYVVGPDGYELTHPKDINTTTHSNIEPINEISYSELCSIINEFGTTYQDEKQRVMDAVFTQDSFFHLEIMKTMERKLDREEPINSALWQTIKKSVTVSDVYRHYGKKYDSAGRNACLMSHPETFWKDVTCIDDTHWRCSCCGESGDAFALFCCLNGENKANGKTNFWKTSQEFSRLAGDRLYKQWQETLIERSKLERRKSLTPEERAEAETKATLEAMDKIHFQCFQDSEAMIAFIPNNPFRDPSLKSERGFKSWYRGHTVYVWRKDKKGEMRLKEVPVADAYLDRKTRPKFEGITFYPKDELPLDLVGFYNTWGGFPATPKEGDFSHIDYHLRHIWCRDNLEHYNYLIGWFAHLFQKPWEKPEVAPVIKGIQGTGKSIIMGGVLGRLLGRYYIQVDKPELFTGKFNFHLYGKLLITCEESIFGGDQAAKNVAKNMITSETLPMEEKGRTPRTESSHHRIVVLSNEEIAIGADGRERRYFGLEVSDEKANDHAYFEQLAHAIKNGEAEAFMYYLLHLDLSNFNVRKQPKTDALAAEFLSNLPLEQQWLIEQLNDIIAIRGISRTWSDDGKCREHDEPIFGRRVPTVRLWAMFYQWMEDQQKSGRYTKRNGPGSQVQLTRKINALLKNGKSKDIRDAENRNLRAIDMPNGKIFRGIFEKIISSGFAWDFPLNEDGSLPDGYEDNLFEEKAYLNVADNPQIYPFVPKNYKGDDAFDKTRKGL